MDYQIIINLENNKNLVNFMQDDEVINLLENALVKFSQKNLGTKKGEGFTLLNYGNKTVYRINKNKVAQ